MRRGLFVLGLAALAAATAHVGAYQTYGVRVDGRVVELKWARLPVRYFVTDRGVTGVSAEDFRAATSRAFATWQGIRGASVSAEFVGFTSAEPLDEDGMVTLGFRQRPDLDRVLGATSFLIDNSTGEIVETDIFINSAFPWSVEAGGQSGRFDLESIVLHEVGHLFGLGHSAIGETELAAGGGRRVVASEAVMFPIAFSAGTTTGRTPRADDIAGLSSLYPAAGSRGTGGISGRVVKGGQGVLGAHVLAFNPRTGLLVGGITVDEQGRFNIASLEPGAYILRAEPLDDADLDSFFDDDLIAEVDLDFRIAYHDRMIVAPSGGSASPIEIEVMSK